MAKGIKTGGRKVGSLNKVNRSVKERCENLGVDVFEVLILTAGNRIECGVCRGTGKSKFQPKRSKIFLGDEGPMVEQPDGKERVCQSCWGSKLERISPKERAWAAAEVAQYIEAKRKAIEHTGEDGGAIEHDHRIIFVGAAPTNGHA